MFKVICPVCKEIREVAARKPWMVGEAPYEKRCKRHAEGKQKSPEHRAKLSASIKALQTEEVREKKRQYMLAHPEYWHQPPTEKAQEAWTGQHHTEESKKKISEGVKKAKGDSNE